MIASSTLKYCPQCCRDNGVARRTVAVGVFSLGRGERNIRLRHLSPQQLVSSGSSNIFLSSFSSNSRRSEEIVSSSSRMNLFSTPRNYADTLRPIAAGEGRKIFDDNDDILASMGIVNDNRDSNHTQLDITKELLCEGNKNIPFDIMRWKDGQQAILGWSQQGTPESVEKSFLLLERLIREQEAVHSKMNHDNEDDRHSLSSSASSNLYYTHSKDVLCTSLLNSVVGNWNLCWRSSGGRVGIVTNEGTRTTSVTPHEMLSKIDAWRSRSPRLQPGVKTYGRIMDAAAEVPVASPNASSRRSAAATESAVFVERVFGKMLQEIEDGTLQERPDKVTYNIIMKAYGRAGYVKEAEWMLQHMHDQYRNQGRADLRPDVRTFSTVLTGWSKSSDPKAAERAEMILDLMTTLSQEGHLPDVKPNVAVYNTVLHCWARSKQKDAAGRAEIILRRMEKQEDGIDDKISIPPPNTISYSHVINAWAQSGKVERALAVLGRMNDRYHREQERQKEEEEEQQGSITIRRRNDHSKVRPDNQTYTTMLKALSRSGRQDAPELAEKVMTLMKESSSCLDLAPNFFTYTALMECWMRSGRPEAAQRTEALLEEMEIRSRRDRSMAPLTASYNIVIQALAKEGDAIRAENIFQRMLERILQSAKTNTSDSGGSSPSSFTLPIYAARPDLGTCNAVLLAWARSKRKDAPERAEEILRNIITLSSNAKLLPDIKPSVVSYSIVLDCWAKSARPEAGERAEEILFEMEKQSQAGNSSVKPDTTSYTTAINAWARKGDARRAEALMQRVFVGLNDDNDDDRHPQGRNVVKPGIQTFNAVLAAWFRSGEFDAPERAESVLKRMLKLSDSGKIDFQPDIVSYNTVLNCWAVAAKNKNNTEAGKRAEKILNSMENRYRNEKDTDDEEEGGGWNKKKNCAVRPNERSYQFVQQAYRYAAASNASS